MTAIKFDFLKYRWLYALISLAVVGTFLGTYFYKVSTRGYAFVFSVDYAGGTQVLLQFSKPVHSEQIVRILEKEGWQGAVARDFSSTEILVRVSEFENDSKGLAERIREKLEANLSDTKIEVRQVDSVGSGTGSTLWKKSLQAIIIGLLLMLLYTWVRFWSLSFGLGVLVSLFHDAIVVLAFFMLFDYEISSNVIAAILTILGYSINDTIVVFARVRENLKKFPQQSIKDITNLSINETLRRTLLTSFATSLVIVALLIFGGHTLRTLSLALMVGIVFGTYSSIAIASQVMVMLFREKRA